MKTKVDVKDEVKDAKVATAEANKAAAEKRIADKKQTPEARAKEVTAMAEGKAGLGTEVVGKSVEGGGSTMVDNPNIANKATNTWLSDRDKREDAKAELTRKHNANTIKFSHNAQAFNEAQKAAEAEFNERAESEKRAATREYEIEMGNLSRGFVEKIGPKQAAGQL